MGEAKRKREAEERRRREERERLAALKPRAWRPVTVQLADPDYSGRSKTR